MALHKPRILFLVQLPPPINGVSVMNRHLVDSARLADRFERLVLPISMNRTLNRLGTFRLDKLARVLVLVLRLLKTLVVNRPRVVYLTLAPFGYAFWRDLGLVTLIKLLGPRLILHIHGQGIARRASRAWLYRRAYRFVFHNSRVIALSQGLTRDLESVYAGRPFVVNNGLDDHAGAAIGRSQREAGPVRILCLSNLIRFKGIEVFLEALAALREQGLDFEGLVAGEEGDLSAADLVRRGEELGLGHRLRYLGGQYGEDKWALLRTADVFVLPSSNDAFPLVIIEAMQFSLPVVSTRTGGIPDLVEDGVTGMLIPPRDAVALAGALKTLAGNPDLRLTLGRAGRRRYEEKFRMERFEAEMAAVFTAVLEAP